MSDTTSSVILGLDVKEFRRGISQVDNSLKQMSRQFSDLGGLIGVSFAGSKLQDFVMQSIDLGLQAEGIARAFERIGNEANLAQMRQQVKGTVNDLNLMQQAVKAENLGIPIQNFTKYLGFAKKQAQEMGTSVDFMVESIVNGVGRQSTLILDNLGISASQLSAELEKGGTFADAVGRIIDTSMAAAGEQVMTTKDKIDAQRASIENLQMAIGQNLLPMYEALLGFVADGFKVINHLMSNHLTLWEKIAYLATYANVTSGAAQRVYLDGLAASRAAMEDITIAAPKMGKGLVTAANQATAGLVVTNKEAQKFVDKLQNMLSLARQFQKEDFEFVAKGEVLQGFEPIDIEEIDMLEGELVPLIEAVDGVKASMMDAASFGAEFGHILSGAFSDAINDGENFFESLKEGLKEYVKQLIIAIATTTILAAIFSAFTGVGFGTAFRAIGQGQGLGNFFGGDSGGMMNFQGRIYGQDLLLGNVRSASSYSRIGG